MAHEFGHAVGIAADPIGSQSSLASKKLANRFFGTPISCQLPENRYETYARTAMDWQERFIKLTNGE